MALRQVKELRERRAKCVADARRILEGASKEKRELSADEQERWDRAMGEVDALAERVGELERELAGDETEEGREEDTPPPASTREDEELPPEEEGERHIRLPDGRQAYVVGSGRAGRPSPGQRSVIRMPWESEHEYRNRQRRSTPQYRAAVSDYLLNGESALARGANRRAIQADSDVIGGYLVMPQQFQASLIKFVDNLLFIRQHATKYVVQSAQSLGAPSLDTDVSDSDWTSELATGNEDTSLAFGKRELTPHPLAKRLKVSNKLLRAATNMTAFAADSGVSGGPEGIVHDRLGYKFAVTEEKAFLTGNGSQRALGVFVASSRGISTGRDVTTGVTDGFTADKLIVAKFTLKPQYHKTARWLFHRDGYSKIRQLKDGMGQYIWAPGLSTNDPDRLLDIPVDLSEYCPNTFTTGLYVGMLADWRFYWIVDAQQLMIQRLVELYAEANQTGYIARLELDGMPVLEEAFVRLKTS